LEISLDNAALAHAVQTGKQRERRQWQVEFPETLEIAKAKASYH
jgi:hypothetical protein